MHPLVRKTAVWVAECAGWLTFVDGPLVRQYLSEREVWLAPGEKFLTLRLKIPITDKPLLNAIAQQGRFVTQSELQQLFTQQPLDKLNERIIALEERTPQTILVYMLDVMRNPLERAKLLQVLTSNIGEIATESFETRMQSVGSILHATGRFTEKKKSA